MDADMRQYVSDLNKELSGGDATEHTHRPALKALIERLVPGITATNEPKRKILVGAPDISVRKGQVPLGYIECKDVGKSLTDAEKTGQFKRYLSHLPNLVLTDYVEFRWYVDGDCKGTARLGTIDSSGKVHSTAGAADQVRALVVAFVEHHAPTVTDPKDLAERMARLAHMCREVVVETFRQEADRGDLHQWLEGFRDVLLPELTPEEFADMYAQTIAYGLFAARCNYFGPDEAFDRRMASYELPKSNPFLRKLFFHIAGPDLDERVAWVADEIAHLLAHADMGAILENFGRRKLGEDPVVHFYETFLAEFDPAKRKARGVYYTPEPVVSYIVRSVDRLLQTHFDKPMGLADPSVIVLDPACGTGTFLHAVIDLVHEKFAGQEGEWAGYVHEKLLPRLFGFEIMMAPYTVAHLKLGLQLEQSGYEFSADERLGIYLTNTLEEAARKAEYLLAQFISEEADAAAVIKRDKPIMVVLGNPPYAGYSANQGAWMEGLMEDYKTTIRSEERQIQRLSNDYVKFVRWAQWRLTRTGSGILGFITDNGYLDGLLFRDMRRCLLEGFDRVMVLNLHGENVRTKIGGPGLDENVFDITQGVCIGLYVKTSSSTDLAAVDYAEIVDTRPNKYSFLAQRVCDDTEWTTIEPRAPQYRFLPTRRDATYETWPYLLEVLGTGRPASDRDVRYGTGVKTRHDSFSVAWSPEEAVERVRRLADASMTDAELMRRYRLCTTAHFNIGAARKRAASADLSDHVLGLTYRPFDTRYVVYLREFICEPKTRLMRHLAAKDNLALAVLRRNRRETRAGFFVARGLVAKDMVSNLDDALVCPLYVYGKVPGNGQSALLGQVAYGPGSSSPNLTETWCTEVAQRLGLTYQASCSAGGTDVMTPYDVFCYIYSIFHSPEYRELYGEFVDRDFPRVPVTSDIGLFRGLVRLGSELVDLHLLEAPSLTRRDTTYGVPGGNIVAKDHPVYRAPGEMVAGSENPLTLGRVYVNKEQYFEGVPPQVWAFEVGGYQVCEKWLKDRRGRQLSYGDLDHYQKVIAALKETISIMARVDEVIDAYGGWPIRPCITVGAGGT